MRQRKVNVWVLAGLSFGVLLFSASVAFASFPLRWAGHAAPRVYRLPKIEIFSGPVTLREIQGDGLAAEACFSEYEAWRRIRSSA